MKYIHTDRQTDRQTDRHRQTDRQTDRIGVLDNFDKLTRKTLVLESLFDKVAGL